MNETFHERAWDEYVYYLNHDIILLTTGYDFT